MATATTPQRGQAETAPQSADMKDWTGADFDSYEVLVLMHIPDPIARARVTRARRGRQEGSAR
ncbi:hypothetical protein [Streptomyces sp. RLB3-6]|uniref:hypothetical protein n=1 Tax=Streptomyces sp. RLB3-6 TaxID=2594457 RepID=UPI001163144E|nr:hypothetical protein [Streptomyces sp. RLB3-6]QDN84352.1 hypothetical protein FNV61_00040 [Streptomyces sp. RLB3-6]